MDRSTINSLMHDADLFFRTNHVYLPPFAYWSPRDWASKGGEVEEIVDNYLGWDITDYGLNDFHNSGLLLFTLRNGGPRSWLRGFNKHYAEKVMIAEVGQIHQMHFHRRKMEDIINRSGGSLAIQIYQAGNDEELSDSEVRVNTDGVWRTIPAGSTLLIRSGESITLTPGIYHRFWAEGERVLMGEVSSTNDDFSDNKFYKMIGTGRFSNVNEDESPHHLLCGEYKNFWKREHLPT
jgi:D-lyxose ketol-isomerase